MLWPKLRAEDADEATTTTTTKLLHEEIIFSHLTINFFRNLSGVLMLSEKKVCLQKR